MQNVNKAKKYDNGKLRYDLIPWECIQELAEIYTFGAEKYTENSWQQLPDFKNRYFSALMRHLLAWWDGEIFDKESGRNHLAHALWNVTALLWWDLKDGMKVKVIDGQTRWQAMNSMFKKNYGKREEFFDDAAEVLAEAAKNGQFVSITKTSTPIINKKGKKKNG